MKYDESIFVIDDDEVVGFIFQRYLSKIGTNYTLAHFTDASDAVERVKSDGGLPSIIFLDINMPGFDGWQFLDFISEQKDYNPNIIMCSSSILEADKEKALAHPNVVRYCVKPVNTNDILHEINRLKTS